MHPEPPLSDRELRIIRGMLDEYEYARRRRQHTWQHLHAWERLAVLAFAGAPALDILLRLTGH